MLKKVTVTSPDKGVIGVYTLDLGAPEQPLTRWGAAWENNQVEPELREQVATALGKATTEADLDKLKEEIEARGYNLEIEDYKA